MSWVSSTVMGNRVTLWLRRLKGALCGHGKMQKGEQAPQRADQADVSFK
jgi:hypothetical protein